MHDEHDLHYRQWRADYERRLDQDYREWLAQRESGRDATRHPDRGGPAVSREEHDEGPVASIGRAVSSVVLESEAQPGGVSGVRGVYEDQTEEGGSGVSRSRGGR